MSAVSVPQWTGPEGIGREGSRAAVAAFVLVLHLALLLLLLTGGAHDAAPESQARVQPPLVVRFIDPPRRPRWQADLPRISPHLVRPAPQVPDAPPQVRIDLPVPPPVAPARAVAPAADGRDVAAGGASRGVAGDPGKDAGNAVLRRVAPLYPVASVRAGEHGQVVLQAQADAQGRPVQVRVSRGSGFVRLDQAALDAVRQYRFAPAASAGDPSWTTVTVEFDLLPMPVPTTVIGIDSTVAGQLAASRRAYGDPRGEFTIMQTRGRIDDLAVRLFNTFKHENGAPEPAPRVAQTPLQALAAHGALQSVRFLGFAGRSPDCGIGRQWGRAAGDRCEVFEVRQAGGASYWFAETSGRGAFRSIAIAVDMGPAWAGGKAR